MLTQGSPNQMLTQGSQTATASHAPALLNPHLDFKDRKEGEGECGRGIETNPTGWLSLNLGAVYVPQGQYT